MLVSNKRPIGMYSRPGVSYVVVSIVVIVILVVGGIGVYLYASSGSSSSTTSTTSSTTTTSTSTAAIPTGTPIKIGFVAQLTGYTAANAVPMLEAWKLWAQNVNLNGGLLGRPVQLVYYDDASNTANDPAIIQKLITVDHVDLLVGQATVNLMAQMPVVMQYNYTMFGTSALGVDSHFNYTRYFDVFPWGPNPAEATIAGFLQIAASQTPKPKTIALVGGDNSFGIPCLQAASNLATQLGFTIVYNKTYSASTTDYTPIILAVKALNPDIFAACSYPTDSIGLIHAAQAENFTPKMFGGAMVGLQTYPDQKLLGTALNGIVTYMTFSPEPSFASPAATAFLKQYQAAAIAGAYSDPLGYYEPLNGYATMQVLQQAVEGCNCLNQAVLAQYVHTHTFQTVMGNLSFGALGEESVTHLLFVQFQNITGSTPANFASTATMPVFYPTEYATPNATLEYPFPGWS